MIVKKLVAVLAAAAFLVTAVAPPAFAGTRYRHSGSGHGYSYYGGHSYKYRPYYRHGYGRHYGYRRHGYGHIGFHGDGAVVFGALAGAVVLGALLSQPRPAPAYAPAVPRSPSGAALGNCVQTLGTGTWNGRPARFAGTRCTDAAGQAYVVNDSVRFLMYLN
ncbi:MAG: hypothetical protein IID48_18445 [Proteobacteria bacterium]|nr:hypothetical protein [Pseudomonadota bacterium]